MKMSLSLIAVIWIAMSWLSADCLAADEDSAIGSTPNASENTAASEKTVSTRDELVAALRDARPGDVIRVAAGTYRGGIELRGIHGTESATVRLVAADAKKPPLFDGGASGLHITDSSFLEINGLHLRNATGNGINIDEGGASRPAARGIVLRNLVVSDVGPKGNRDGIKLSGLDNFKVEDCRVERWGTGGSGIDLVGCHDGVISGCSFQRDPADKEGAQQANGVQMKGGSARIVVRRCLFKNAGGRAVNLGGSTGKEYFRPLGADHEARDLTVEDCQFIGGMTPVAFVGVDAATVRYNTIYHPGRWGLRILQENRGPEFVPSRNGVFSNNIVVFRSDQLAETVNIGPGTAPDTFTFADNVWYCDDRPDQSQRRVRLPVSEKNGTYGVDPLLVDPMQDRLNLTANSPVKNAGVRMKQPVP